MNDAAFMGKKESLDAIDEILESAGYKILAAEIKRLRDQGEADVCNVELPSAKRDAGAGARNMGDALLSFLELKRKSLESTLGKEKDARRHKRRSQ